MNLPYPVMSRIIIAVVVVVFLRPTLSSAQGGPPKQNPNQPMTQVSHDGTLTGTGTSSSPLGVADGAIVTGKLADNAVTSAKVASGQVVKTLNGLTDNVTLLAGDNITVNPAGNTLTGAVATGSGGTFRN